MTTQQAWVTAANPPPRQPRPGRRTTPMILVVPRGPSSTIVPTERILRIARDTLGDATITLQDVNVRFMWDDDLLDCYAGARDQSTDHQLPCHVNMTRSGPAGELNQHPSPDPSSDSGDCGSQDDRDSMITADFPSRVHVRNLALGVTEADLYPLIPPHLDVTHMSLHVSQPALPYLTRQPSQSADVCFGCIEHVCRFLQHMRALYANNHLAHLQVDADHPLSVRCPGYEYYYAIHCVDQHLPSPEDLSFETLSHVFIGNLVEDTLDEAIFALPERAGVPANKVFARPPRARAFGLPRFRGARFHFKTRDEAMLFGQRLVAMSEGVSSGMGIEWMGELVVRY